MKLYFKYIK